MEILKYTITSCLLIIFGAKSIAQELLIDSLNQQAYQRYRQNVTEAKSIAYQALALAEQGEFSTQTVDSYINLGRCFRLTNQWDSAYKVLELAVKISEEKEYHIGMVNATNNLGACYRQQGKTQEAGIWFQRSLDISEKIDYQKGKANALNNLFVIAQERQSFDSAFMFLSKATLVYQQTGDSSGIATVYSNKGFLFDILQEIDSAIFYFIKALQIQESKGLLYQQAQSYHRIGRLYEDKEQLEDAFTYYDKALALFTEIGDISELANIHNSIGYNRSELKKYPEALSHLEKGVKYARQSESPYLIGSNLINLANVYLEQDIKEQLAQEMLEEAIEHLEGWNTFNLAVAYSGLGDIAWRKKNLNTATKWFGKELEIAREFGEPNIESNALYNLSTIYQSQNQPSKALDMLREYQAIRDSLDTVETLETINNLNIKYETEKKEKDNLQLQTDLQAAQLAEEKQKNLRNKILGLGSLIIFIGLVGFLWFRYRQRLRIKEQEVELEKERIRKEQQAKEAAKLRELDAMKTRFFTNISHEFRTPLTLIIGKNGQMQETSKDPQLQNGFEMVGRNGHRLLDLVNQVLDVAKLEAGGMELEMAKIDAISYLKNIFYSFETMAEDKGVKMVFAGGLKKLETAFDLKKFERVIFNLLSNAMKFTPEKGEIRMEVKRIEDQMKITLSDSGVGIKASQLPYIFDRFYQADSSENQPQPGTGIGLSLVKELIELHKGEIKVESELNKGTTFIISLPIPADIDSFATQSVDKQLKPEALPSKTIAASAEPAFSATKKEQILLIEDNDDIRAFVKEQILSFGYQVHEAADGVEGLEKAQQIIPDLIISDIMMPRLDGYGVAKGLKADQRTSHIPLVLLTSKASDDSKIAGLELGIDDYLLKPFNARELEIRIGNLIEQRRRLRERFSSATVIRPNEVSAVSMDQTFLKTVLEAIEANLSDEQFGVEPLAEHAGMSVNNLNRKLSALVDQTAGKLIRSMRLQRAADLLKQKSGTIAEIAYDTGFNSHASFNRSFKQQFGVSPTEYIKENEGKDII